MPTWGVEQDFRQRAELLENLARAFSFRPARISEKVTVWLPLRKKKVTPRYWGEGETRGEQISCEGIWREASYSMTSSVRRRTD